MADRKDPDHEVLTSLPHSRPVRRSAKRGAPATAAKTGSAPAKPSAAPKPATPRRTAGAGMPRATTDRAKTRTKPAATAAPPRRPVREPERVAPARKVPPAGYAAPATSGESERGSDAARLLSTAVQAANELTQIGLTVGRQALQSMLDRLPKP
jgi:hypothetical protein